MGGPVGQTARPGQAAQSHPHAPPPPALRALQRRRLAQAPGPAPATRHQAYTHVAAEATAATMRAPGVGPQTAGLEPQHQRPAPFPPPVHPLVPMPPYTYTRRSVVSLTKEVVQVRCRPVVRPLTGYWWLGWARLHSQTSPPPDSL
jgi:hypothetical protein